MIAGSKIIFLKKAESTNSIALNLLRDSAPPEGTVICTNFQTAGRGQKGNKWESEDGKNLLFSIILYPESITPENQFVLSMAISLGIRDFLESFSIDASIKWPNDIYVKNDKIAGILIENALMGNRIVNSVAGTGLNINQTFFPEYLPNPVSMKILTGKDYEIDTCLREILVHLDRRYKQLMGGNLSKTRNDYVAALYRIMEWHKFKTASGLLTGRIISVTEHGLLQIEERSGRILEFSFREVDFIQ